MSDHADKRELWFITRCIAAILVVLTVGFAAAAVSDASRRSDQSGSVTAYGLLSNYELPSYLRAEVFESLWQPFGSLSLCIELRDEPFRPSFPPVALRSGWLASVITNTKQLADAPRAETPQPIAYFSGNENVQAGEQPGLWRQNPEYVAFRFEQHLASCVAVSFVVALLMLSLMKPRTIRQVGPSVQNAGGH